MKIQTADNRYVTEQGRTKLPAVFVAVALLASMSFVLFGCSTGAGSSGANSNGTSSGSANVANPVVEVDDVATINEELNLNLVIPDDAAVEFCAVIDNSLGEVNFELYGQLYTYRGQITNTDEDISGLYYDFATNKTGETAGQAYMMEFIEGGPGYTRWYDDISGTVYSVSVESGTTSAMLDEIAGTLIAAQ